MFGLLLWKLAAFAVAAYCVAKAVGDFRARRYLWGVMGLASAAVILFTPIQTHAVKLDLPVAPG